MNNDHKEIHIFDKEIGYLKKSSHQKALIYLLEFIPNYFYHVECSSTGKYHPKFSSGEGGLLRHTKAAVRIAIELLNDEVIGNKYSDDEKDIMIMGLILHDALKMGNPKEEYTRIDHPLLSANLVSEHANNLELKEEEIKLLIAVIKSHMGPWNKDYKGNVILPIPKTKYENFVHLCDYLSSRKFLDIKFIDNEIVE